MVGYGGSQVGRPAEAADGRSGLAECPIEVAALCERECFAPNAPAESIGKEGGTGSEEWLAVRAPDVDVIELDGDVLVRGRGAGQGRDGDMAGAVEEQDRQPGDSHGQDDETKVQHDLG